jgi:hypothetical protein
MSRPAFFVDGIQEKKIIQNLCPKSPVQITNINGEDVRIEAIAKRLHSLIKLLGTRYYPIVILIDRECRAESAIDIEINLHDELRRLGTIDELRIGVADRMIENWILADWENFATYTKIPIKGCPCKFEGTQGKGKIKKYFRDYHETTDGVQLFLCCNPKMLCDKSPSFERFISKLQDIKCFWLKNCISN